MRSITFSDYFQIAQLIISPTATRKMRKVDAYLLQKKEEGPDEVVEKWRHIEDLYQKKLWYPLTIYVLVRMNARLLLFMFLLTFLFYLFILGVLKGYPIHCQARLYAILQQLCGWLWAQDQFCVSHPDSQHHSSNSHWSYSGVSLPWTSKRNCQSDISVFLNLIGYNWNHLCSKTTKPLCYA